MSSNAVIVAVCSVGSGVMGLIAGLLIMFVIKSCRTKVGNTDIETDVSFRREPFPQVYDYRNENIRSWENTDPVASQITNDGESGIYCRISKFDIPVVTEDAAVQTTDDEADYVYLIKYEQGVQCDIISTCSSPTSPCNQPTSSFPHGTGMSYSTYRRHIRDAFSTWQIVQAATNNSNICDKNWSHPLPDHRQYTGNVETQNEAADDNDVLMIKLTPNVRDFLHMNGLCDKQSSAEVQANVKQTHKTIKQIVTSLEGSSQGNSTNIHSAISGLTVEAEDHYVRSDEDYLPMEGQNDDDYLPMENPSENDEYVESVKLDNYSCFSSFQRKDISTKPICVKTSAYGDNELRPVECDTSDRCYVDSSFCTGCVDDIYDDCKSEDSSENEDYLPMTTKTAPVNEDYYNCNHLKVDDDDYVPVDDHSLSRRRGSSTHNSDYINYRPRGGHADEC
ncbi:uncharacterized protein LOC132563558 [Ylistrum balloti]|uniref:uncharacterized protein LOC132563558 n=1 Tax=Ylistrum balloti TaxID=509963 RepID=UPI002905C9DC|nr:uncharacterized protein LOC132563558 [Ylistrum balloti]